MRYRAAPDGVVAGRARARRRTAAPRSSATPPGFHGAVWEPLSAALGAGLRAVGDRLPGPRRLRGAAGHPLPWSAVPRRRAGRRRRPRRRARAAASASATRWAAPRCCWPSRPARAPSPGSGSSSRSSRRPAPCPRSRGQQPARRGRRTAATQSFASLAEARWRTTPRSRRSTWPAPTPSTPTSATGFVAGEDGAVHLACRPDDEARIYRGRRRPRRPSTASARSVARSVVVRRRRRSGPVAFAPAIADGAAPRPPRAPRAPQPLRSPRGARPSWRPRSGPSPPTL